MAKKVINIDEVRKAIHQDGDFDVEELERLAGLASSFIETKTGYDFGKDDIVEPLALQCAKLYVKQQYFGSDGYNKEYDYGLGIGGLIVDLQTIAIAKNAAAAEEA
jgi:hypothetical protein